MDYILTADGMVAADSYLMHYGVKGMKWGIRRYQDYGEGGYNPKTERKVAGKYNFKKSEAYTSASKAERREIRSDKRKDHFLNRSVLRMNKKDARRFDYIKDNYGKGESDRFRKKAAAKKAAKIGAFQVSKKLIGAGVKAVAASALLNIMVAEYGQRSGLNTIQGERLGIRGAAKYAKAGKAFAAQLLKSINGEYVRRAARSVYQPSSIKMLPDFVKG